MIRVPGKCSSCPPNTIEVERAEDGMPLPEVKCVRCAPGTKPSHSQTSCVPCNKTPLLLVWSLTQFYSDGFSQSRIGVDKCIFNKRTIIKVCVSCFWQCPGDSTQRCPCISLVPEAMHKASQGSETRELPGGTEENSVSPTRCH